MTVESEAPAEGRSMNDTEPLTPAEALVGGVILYTASDPRIQAMAAGNDREHFVEGCRGPWFDQLVGQALLAVKEAMS